MTLEIEHLYQVFSRYPRPTKMNHSPLVAGGNIHRAITRHPLREIPHEYLSAYAARAMTTVGNTDNFRHFLPRILELLAGTLDQEMDPEQVLAKLDYGSWKEWPPDEQQAIRAYLKALWHLKSQTEEESDTWLCAIAQVENDLTPYLQSLPFLPSLNSPWWDQRPAQKQQAADYLNHRFTTGY